MQRPAPRRWAITLLALCSCAALAGCSLGGQQPQTTTSQGTASAQGEASTPPVNAAATLDCADQMGAGDPEGRLSVVSGVVALPEASSFGPVDAPRNPEDHEAATRLYAKQPLFIRVGSSFDLIVPPEERDRLAIGWGNAPGTPTWKLHVSCEHQQQAWPAGEKWMTFAGGYYAPEPFCASLIVRADGQDRRVHLGVGTDCPGP